MKNGTKSDKFTIQATTVDVSQFLRVMHLACCYYHNVYWAMYLFLLEGSLKQVYRLWFCLEDYWRFEVFQICSRPTYCFKLILNYASRLVTNNEASLKYLFLDNGLIHGSSSNLERILLRGCETEAKPATRIFWYFNSDIYVLVPI